MGREWKYVAVAVLGFLVGTTAVAAWVNAHGGDSSLIHSCVTTRSDDDDDGRGGRIRIVGPEDACKKNETALDWAIRGPQGEQGPPGATSDDTLSGLACSLGQVATWNGSAWVCGDLSAFITTIDGPGVDAASPAIGADGMGLISYTRHGVGLRVAHCDNPLCTSATVSTLDAAGGGTLTYPSVTIGGDGLGLISYKHSVNKDLRVAHCNNVTCTSATISTLDSVGDGGYTSITTGTDGLGLISYFKPFVLKVAHCDNPACTSTTITNVDSSGFVWGGSSITLGSDGLGLISYIEQETGTSTLKAAHCDNIACTTSTLADLGILGSVAETSIATGGDGLGLISYHVGGDLQVAHCQNPSCTSATVTSVAFTETRPSITRGTDGLGLISYLNGSDLTVARCSDAACTSVVPDDIGSSGSNPAIVLGTDDLALISYTSGSNLKVAHCANHPTFCDP